jgi:hypothetical protein
VCGQHTVNGLHVEVTTLVIVALEVVVDLAGIYWTIRERAVETTIGRADEFSRGEQEVMEEGPYTTHAEIEWFTTKGKYNVPRLHEQTGGCICLFMERVLQK